jgi:hypothetical membrane protein
MPRTRLWFGPLATALFFLGIATLPLGIPGYSQVRQTVSEIGEVGSPMRLPFTVLMLAVSACLLVFASSLRRCLRAAGTSSLAAWFVVATAVSGAGVGIFSFPHPLHNVFGLSETVGYQAPLAFALSARTARFRAAVAWSWIAYALVIAAIALNLSVLDTRSTLWAIERPIYGLVQRFLFATWFVWCAVLAWMLLRPEAALPSRT